MNTQNLEVKTLRTFVRVFQKPLMWSDDPSATYKCTLSLRQDNEDFFIHYHWNVAPPSPLGWDEYLTWNHECIKAFLDETDYAIDLDTRRTIQCDVLMPLTAFITKNLK